METTTTASVAAAGTEAAISASEHEQFSPQGRPDLGAVRPRTEELYGSHGRMVAGLCRVLLRDRAEAEDAAQQVFLSAHRALLNGSEPREPAAWLATIARNECWARARARMREPLAVQDVEVAGGLADPVEEAARRADLAALWRAVAELPQQQRDALLLREFGGLSYEELAVALAVTGPAVESLLFRARQGLRVRLKAVYAAFTGASWIDALVRLVAGGSAPVATKAVAIGLGAAALSGGAAFAPRAFDHPARAKPPEAPAKPAAKAPAPAPAAPVSAVRLPVPHRVRPAAAPVVLAAAPPPSAPERQRSGADDGGEHVSGPAEPAGSGETEDDQGLAGPALLPPVRTVSGSDDGGGDGSPQGVSDSSGHADSGGSGSEDGSSGGSGDGGGGDSSGGGSDG